MPENSRFFDQAEQDLPAGATSFTGMLRAADLLSRNILLLDVQLLDGVLFLDRGPGTVRAVLVRDLGQESLTVLCRAPSLEESLRSMLLDKDEQAATLKKFEFSALSRLAPDLQQNVAANLHLRRSERLRDCSRAEVARTVAAELQAASLGPDAAGIDEPTGVFAELADAWETWFAEAAAQRIAVRQWEGNFNLLDALRRRPRFDDAELAAAQEDLAGIDQRSLAREYLQSLQPSAAGHRNALADWWMSSYFDALARQHGTTWLRFREEADAAVPIRRFSRGSTGSRDADTIQFQGSLVSMLHDMPPQAYALLRHQAREAIRDWHANPSQKTSDNLAYAVAQANSTVSRPQVRRAMWTKVGLTLFPAITGALAAGFSDSLFTGVSTALLSVLSIAVAVPLVELADLHATRRKRMRTYIHFPGMKA
ncbi:hypothetical protein H9638_08015 [Arthrobacter sp. Sa2BUA2]|uniref:Uncharacterized protein n=1 Tax=Arthrobacter pullicola TaxID=2762224 RepID=A0ABR8YHS0_9MICC|nr:hypothetical protein [Arthrobacter pullicola]MBD8043758.1 hypothetical protein [Arthrobacter pullicola]